MTQPAVPRAAGAPLVGPLRPRDRDQRHRASTPLELLFDLCFVVAVAQAAAHLHDALASGHAARGVLGYAMVFFAIWWAWMNFTWFASAYDSDDVAYRLLTLVQIAGVLLLAAGVPAAFDRMDLRTVTAGYVVMRMALVTQWLRAAHDDPAGRGVALRYAAGVAACQAGWVARLALPQPAAVVAVPLLVAAELAVPVWAERAGRSTPWHPDHIAERYGLFTLIVLGESVLAATNTVQAAVAAGGLSAALVVTAAGGLLCVFGLWWCYFDRSAAEGLRLSSGGAFAWGYGHLLVFACLAAVGAGLSVAADVVAGQAGLADRAAALAFAVPTAVYLATTGLLHTLVEPGSGDRPVARFTAAAAAVLLVAAATPPVPLAWTVAAVGLVVAGLVAVDVARRAAAAPRAAG